MTTKYSSNPDLKSQEKETIIRFDNSVDHATVHTFNPTVAKWVANHPEAEIIYYDTAEGTKKDLKTNQDHEVYGVKAKLPMACLQLKGKPRSSNHTNRILGRLPKETKS